MRNVLHVCIHLWTRWRILVLYLTVPVTKLLLSLVKFGQLPARAQRGAHLRRAVEQRVIHLVALPLLRVRDHRLEPVTPQDLLGQVARSRLGRLPGRLYRPLEDGHDLEPFRQHVLRGHVVERGLLVYPVDDRCRPYEEQVPVLPVRPHRQLLLILRQHLPLLRRPRPYQLSPDRGPDYVTLPHVAYPKHQAQFTVPLTDDRVSREQQRLSPLLRPAHLGEHYSHHERLDHHPDDALDAHDEDRLGAFLGRATAPVTDRVLGLDAEQEAAREREYVVHARRPVVLDLVGGQVALLEVAVAERDQPPDHGEAQPREDEAQAEAEQHPSPLSVHQGREDVSQEAQGTPRDTGLEDVAVPVLQHGSTAQLSRWPCSVPTPEKRSHKSRHFFNFENLRENSVGNSWKISFFQIF